MSGHDMSIPVFLWGPKAPGHRIAALALLPNHRTLVTADAEGQLLVWQNDEPTYMIFPAAKSPVTALAAADTDPSSETFVAATANGQTSLWDARDGRNLETVSSGLVHTSIRPHGIRTAKGRVLRLFACGRYPELFLLDPESLQPLASLASRVEPDWLNAFAILRPPQRTDIVIGLSGSGMAKIWSLSDMDTRDLAQPIYEDESKQIACQGATQLDPCHLNQRAMLLCGPKEWQVFDAADFSLVMKEAPPPRAAWLGAAFTKIDKVAAFADDGGAYLYQLPRNAILGEAASGAPPFDKTFCYCRVRLGPEMALPLSGPPVFHFVDKDRGVPPRANTPSLGCEIIRGDSCGRLIRWALPVVTDRQIAALSQENFAEPPEIKPSSVSSLTKVWASLKEKPRGILGHLADDVDLTATLYIGSQGRLILGRKDGLIILVSATQALTHILLSHNKPADWPSHRVLDGHSGESVTCLLYPYEEHPRYDPAHLLSGGQDFAICLWDLRSGSRLTRFCVQAGPILRLCVPPPACSARVLQSVCSVAADHSVALVGLKDQKLVLLASRHLYPVLELFWRPADDFLLVKTQDAALFVWQMETGHLDRVVRGMIADEMVAAVAEIEEEEAEGGEADAAGEAGAHQAIQMMRAIKHRNVAAMKRVAHIGERASARDETSIDISSLPPPMLIRAVRAAPEDPDAHALLINVESLIIGLLAEENAAAAVSASSSEASLASEPQRDASPSLSGLLARAKDKAEAVLRASPQPARKSSTANDDRGRKAGLALPESSLHMEVAQVAMSLLHGWGLDKDLDRVCAAKLGLILPRSPGLCFGLLSRSGALSVRTPNALGPAVRAKEGESDFAAFSTRLHWQMSPSLTTQHLLTVIATANTLMSMSNAGFLPDQEKKRRLIKRISVQQSHPPGHADLMESMATEASQIKQGWSLLAALHCVLLPELVPKGGPSPYAAPRIELLARRWQERCLELREAAQALLLRELNRLGTQGRRALVETWAPYLPTNLDDVGDPGLFAGTSLALGPPAQTSVDPSSLPRTPPGRRTALSQLLPADRPISRCHPSLSIFGRPIGALPSGPPPPGPTSAGGGTPAAVSHSGQLHPASGGTVAAAGGGGSLLGGEPGPTAGNPLEASLQAVRRNQATAVVVLGVVGAEFGQEMTAGAPLGAGGTPQQAPPKGFSSGDHGLARGTAAALLELLVQPDTPLLPAFSPLRRAAVDLLGRGFVVWQPYLDISKVLLGLLELAAPADRLLPNGPILFPLQPRADACRTARHALALIATARPPAVITALSKEVARQNAAAAAGMAHSASPLLKARAEILRLVELLTEKRYTAVLELIIAVGDILVHCLDTSLFKQQSLAEVFPPIAKFYMVSYCGSSRRIAFGSPSGSIALHELRASKCQTIQAHSKAITALAFSEDGKHLASYSADEGKVNFWQASGSFLGMGTSQIKCVKQVPAPAAFPVQTPGGTPSLFRARLVWVGPKALTLLLPNGKEHRFSM